MSLRNSLTNGLQNVYYHAMMPYWQSQFSPYIGNVEIGETSFQFFYGTPLSRSWYDPIKPHVMAEYLWVQQNLDLANQKIIDAGAHHGHYSVYFASMRGDVTAVEPLPGNAALIKVNAALNQLNIKVIEAAVSDEKGEASFIPRSNGKLFAGVGVKVPVTTLRDIDPDASVVRLDIEGAEFKILPKAIEIMPKTSVWIIEAHQRSGSAHELATDFSNRGFAVNYLEKKSNKVIPFVPESIITGTTTIFCIK